MAYIPPPIVFQSVVRDLTAAEIRSLNSSPIEVVPAPGAGLILVPLSWDVQRQVTSAMSASTTWSLVYTGRSTSLIGTFTSSLTTQDTRWGMMGGANYAMNANSDVNTGLTMRSSADVTGGAATARVVVHYMVVPSKY
jgi:hypothetical protein